jgi:hypothetical protein
MYEAFQFKEWRVGLSKTGTGVKRTGYEGI